MFLLLGTKYITWGSQKTNETIRCSNCGALAQFTEKNGMNFISLFFLVPVIPISGKKKFIECPNCKARFETV
ncbi:MAG: zinc-ribbon domain-containing protein [Acidobacteria bacterium]|jgi:transcription elongation factor Elf1|nr:zinc-ribbon domain-containing protein [Acidobacteriota bacterium]